MKKNKRLISKKQQTKKPSSIFRSIRSYLRRNADIGTIVGIAFSIVALGISYRSCDTADKAFEYTKSKDLAEKSPAIIFRLESGALYFDLNKNFELQTIFMKFPDSIQSKAIIEEGNSIHITVDSLERVVWKYYAGRLSRTTKLTELKVPVVIDFEAVVDKQPTLYREDHFLRFDIVTEENEIRGLRYTGNRLNYPLTHPQEFNEREGKELRDYTDRRFAEVQEWNRQNGLILF